MSPRVFVGIDGGNSKTAAVAVDAAGVVLARVRAGASAIVGTPSDEGLAPLVAVARELLEAASVGEPAVASWGIGISGIDFDDEQESQEAAVRRGLGIGDEHGRMLTTDRARSR